MRKPCGSKERREGRKAICTVNGEVKQDNLSKKCILVRSRSEKSVCEGCRQGNLDGVMVPAVGKFDRQRMYLGLL